MMNSLPFNSTLTQTVTVKNGDRWQVYYRLQELEIPCKCLPHKPLEVEINHPIAGIQLWSVVRNFSASRSELVDWLNDCWKINSNNCK